MAVPSAPDGGQLLALRHRLDPADPVALANLAWLSARAGELELAQQAARQAAALPGAPRSA
ncbi:MAG: hypothetical protein KC485_05295, partial [Gemmatimonadetes bacterium]|nr:hypothetical protein [Gemmatimonadota bacterium]